MNQLYFRTQNTMNGESEYSLFQAIHDNKVIQLMHQFVMEMEKPNSYYNRFKDSFTLKIYEWNEQEMKMKELRSIEFKNLVREQNGVNTHGNK